MIDDRRLLQGPIEGVVQDGGQDLFFVVGQAKDVRFSDEIVRTEVVFADIDKFTRFMENRSHLQ